MPATHYDEPINKAKPLSGTGRHAWEVSPEVQQKIVDIIIEEARKLGFNNRDIAYYLAIAKRESRFNPDAANEGGTASGIAQVTDATGSTYNINDSNRFDARSSIKAGLSYFSDLKKETVNDYGSAAGKYEALIYYRYHYGEYSTRHLEEVEEQVRGKKRKHKVYRPNAFEELEKNHKYADSQTVVDEAARIEKIFNDSHGLKIQLTDVMGKPMAGRKVIAVSKIAKAVPAETNQKKASSLSDQAVSVPVSAPTAVAGPISTPTGAADETVSVALSTSQENLADKEGENEKEPGVREAAIQEGDEKTAASQPVAGNETEEPSVPVEWEVRAVELVTDADGHIPEIESKSQEPVLILIPRIDYEAYNDAIAKQAMQEDGNQHIIKPHDGETVPPQTVKAEVQEEKQPAALQPEKAKSKAPKPSAPKADIFSAADKHSKDAAQTSKPSAGHDITFKDVVHSLTKDLGWKNVYSTSFAYIKQFYTRPKLPEKPLDPDTPTQKSAARTQTIGSSLKNKEVKAPKENDRVTTAKDTAVKDVKAVGDATWMPVAIQEQKKDGAEKVERIDGSQISDKTWKAEFKKYKDTDAEVGKLKRQLATEARLPEKKRDAEKIKKIENEIQQQESIKHDASEKMSEQEKKYNNQDILKYLKSTGMESGPGQVGTLDETFWCASFVNWCLQDSGYVGPKLPARAESWKDWGRELKEPLYGAITIVTRKGGFHIGFFTGIVQKNILDGFEEVEQKNRKGEVVKVKKPKFKKINYVRLLSGNMTHRIRELAEWSEGPEDDLHLVSYRWPTEKEKKGKQQ